MSLFYAFRHSTDSAGAAARTQYGEALRGWLLHVFRFVSYMQQRLPQFWLSYPDALMRQCVGLTLSLAALPAAEGCCGPAHFMALADPPASWLRAWALSDHARVIMIDLLDGKMLPVSSPTVQTSQPNLHAQVVCYHHSNCLLKMFLSLASCLAWPLVRRADVSLRSRGRYICAHAGHLRARPANIRILKFVSVVVVVVFFVSIISFAFIFFLFYFLFYFFPLKLSFSLFLRCHIPTYISLCFPSMAVCLVNIISAVEVLATLSFVDSHTRCWTCTGSDLDAPEASYIWLNFTFPVLCPYVITVALCAR